MSTIPSLSENTAPDGTDVIYSTDGTNDEKVQIKNLLKGSGAEVPAAKITGTVAHEQGGLEADVSAFDGLVKISSGATTDLKCNFSGTTAPGTTDDSVAGYSIGSLWFDTITDKKYTCVDATASGAIWTSGATPYLDPTLDDLGTATGTAVGWTKTTNGTPSASRYTFTSNTDGYSMSPDGTMVFCKDGSTYQRWDLSTAYDVSTASLTTTHSGPWTGSAFWTGWKLADDGKHAFYPDQSSATKVILDTFSTAWDPTTISSTNTTLPSGGSAYSQQYGFWPKPDGTKLYTCGMGGYPYIVIKEYSMSTAWDITTLSYVTEVTYYMSSGYNMQNGSFQVVDSGKRIQYYNPANRLHYWYEMNTAYDLSSGISSYGTISYTGYVSPVMCIMQCPGRSDGNDGHLLWHITNNGNCYEIPHTDVGAASVTFDLSGAGVFYSTVTSAGVGYTFSNAQTIEAFRLELTNGAAGTITWPTSVDWAGGSAPTFTASGVDVLEFFTSDSGTTWHGRILNLDSK